MAAPTTQTPRSKPVLFLFLGIVAFTLTFGIVALIRSPTGSRDQAGPLLVYCAASLKAPLEAIAADYERGTSQRVELSFGGSQTLLASIEVTKMGDLYLPADESYIRLAQERKLVTDVFPLAEQTAVIATTRGNPKRIQSLSDLTNRNITLSQASPEAAAIGKLLRAATLSSGLWSALSNRTVVFKPSVTDAANDVKLGAVDAAIVWDSMQRQYQELDFIRAPEVAAVKAHVTASVLNCSKQPKAALEFARYLSAPDKGLKRFAEGGFKVGSAPQ